MPIEIPKSEPNKRVARTEPSGDIDELTRRFVLMRADGWTIRIGGPNRHGEYAGQASRDGWTGAIAHCCESEDDVIDALWEMTRGALRIDSDEFRALANRHD